VPRAPGRSAAFPFAREQLPRALEVLRIDRDPLPAPAHERRLARGDRAELLFGQRLVSERDLPAITPERLERHRAVAASRRRVSATSVAGDRFRLDTNDAESHACAQPLAAELLESGREQDSETGLSEHRHRAGEIRPRLFRGELRHDGLALVQRALDRRADARRLGEPAQ